MNPTKISFPPNTQDVKSILCIDFDGTLIDNQNRIHPQDVEVFVNFPKSILPVMTTGRDIRSIKKALQEQGIFTGTSFPLPGVYMNGGVTYLPGELICQIHPFSLDTRSALISLANQFPHTAFNFFGLDMAYLINPNPFGRRIANNHLLIFKEVNSADVPENIIKVLVLEPDGEMLNAVKTASKGLSAEIATSLPYAFEINPPGITKAASVADLVKTLGVSDRPIFAVGDAENDLTLFRLAQTSFAPTTAHPSVLERADYLIPRNPQGILTPILDHIHAVH